MDAPQTKAALVSAMEAGRREWDALLSQIGAHDLEQPGVEGVWSVKQIVAHVAGYEEWTGAFVRDRLDPTAGTLAAFDAFWQRQLDAYRRDRPDFPARMSETDDDQTNALVVATYDRYSAREVLERERRAYEQLLSAIRVLPEARLSEPVGAGGRPLAAILPNQCHAHYQMHMPAIRRWLERRPNEH